jgi:hypothetical protein
MVVGNFLGILTFQVERSKSKPKSAEEKMK